MHNRHYVSNSKDRDISPKPEVQIELIEISAIRMDKYISDDVGYYHCYKYKTYDSN